MLRTAFALLLLHVATPACAQIAVVAQDTGGVYQANAGKSTILFNNLSDKPVKILSVVPSKPSDRVGDFKFPVTVAPKTAVNVPIVVFNDREVGDHWHLFTIGTDITNQPQAEVLVHLFGLSVLDDPKPLAELGTVNTNARPPTKEVSLSSREVMDFRIVRLVDVPDFVTASILADGKTISISANVDAAWGQHDGFVKVDLNSPVQPQAWIEVKADVHGEVIPSENPVALGVFRTTDAPFIVQLKSRNGSPVRLGKISLEGFKAKITTTPCTGNASGCTQMSIKLSDGQRTGKISGKLVVDLPDFHRQLPLGIGGLYLPKSIKVHSLNEAIKGSGTSSKESETLDLKSALQHSTQPAAIPPVDPVGEGPLLKWQVSNEKSIYGYLIYRSDSQDGPYLRVNKNIVLVDTTKGDGVTSSYVWRDTSVVSGKSYWYYIGLINRSGSKQQLSGPQKVIAK